mgnify:CR=1 FL=1
MYSSTPSVSTYLTLFFSFIALRIKVDEMFIKGTFSKTEMFGHFSCGKGDLNPVFLG